MEEQFERYIRNVLRLRLPQQLLSLDQEQHIASPLFLAAGHPLIHAAPLATLFREQDIVYLAVRRWGNDAIF